LQACDRSAVVWDARSGRCELRYEGIKGDVNAVRFFPSGEMLGAACNDGSVSKKNKYKSRWRWVYSGEESLLVGQMEISSLIFCHYYTYMYMYMYM
jgi:WD40 repeat protein